MSQYVAKHLVDVSDVYVLITNIITNTSHKPTRITVHPVKHGFRRKVSLA